MAGKPTVGNKLSLLEQAKAVQRPTASWPDVLAPAQVAEINEVLRARVSGELALSIPQLVKLFNDNSLGATKHKVSAALGRIKASTGG